MRRALIWLGAALLAVLLAWWVIRSVKSSSAEEIAVAKEQARVEAAKVKALEEELTVSRAESHRVDTVVRTILRNPPPVRPVAPPRPVLDTLGRDSLIAVLDRSEAYGDTVQKENAFLRATLDESLTVFRRYQVAADSTIAAQGRQIVAQMTIIDVQECRIMGLLKCPSRKVAFVGGAVLTFAAVRVANR